jgi:hypothetical protein
VLLGRNVQRHRHEQRVPGRYGNRLHLLHADFLVDSATSTVVAVLTDPTTVSIAALGDRLAFLTFVGR